MRVRVGLSVIALKSGSQPEDWRPNPADDLRTGSCNWNWRVQSRQAGGQRQRATGAGRQPHPAADGTDRRPNPANDLLADSRSGRTTGKIRLKKVLKIHSLWYTIKKVRFVIRMVEFCCPDREEELCQEFLK